MSGKFVSRPLIFHLKSTPWQSTGSAILLSAKDCLNIEFHIWGREIARWVFWFIDLPLSSSVKKPNQNKNNQQEQQQQKKPTKNPQ